MKFLLNVPLIRFLAEWVWLVDPTTNTAGDDSGSSSSRNDDKVLFSPDLCVGSLPLMPVPCWTQLLAKGLGVAIILGSIINKAPMIVNLLSSKSTEGLSKQSLYGEVLLVANSTAYGMLSGHPFTAYGENVSLLIQSIVIVGLLWRYNSEKSIPTTEKGIVSALGVAYVFFVRSMPKEWHHFLVAAGWPVMVLSRATQIWESSKVKHTGALSSITLGLNVAGVSARLFTTLQEVGFDVVLLAGYTLSFLTNSAMLLQYVLYRKNTLQFLERVKAEQAQEAKKAKQE